MQASQPPFDSMKLKLLRRTAYPCKDPSAWAESVVLNAEVLLRMQAQALIKRTYLLKDIGIEIFFSGRNSLYLTFKTSADRDRVAGKPAAMPPSICLPLSA